MTDNPWQLQLACRWDDGHVAGLNLGGRGKGDKTPAAKRKSAAPAPKSVSTSRRTKTEKFTASTVGQIGVMWLKWEFFFVPC